eukprot:GFUD01013315.1.p1 GENE.GFUD01013315.1~~GFUD01013315.1.p1  ORF type:complete len:1215 (-),score=291.42 GFUD01013315.1:329-3973(-)
MDPNAWQAYQAAAASYSNRFSSSQQDDGNPYHNPAFLLAHQQLREAASQHYQNQILPPSLVQAAANNKNQLHQQALANLNMRESVMSSNALLTPPVTPVSTAWSKASNEISRSRDEQPQQRRSVIEAKTSQPAFPGQPPPLTDSRVGRNLDSPSPAFPGQPPPRQSSQPRSSSQAAFPGLPTSSNHYSQQHSPQYGNNYSPQAPSPQGYHSVHSPQEYHSSQRRDQERKAQNPDRHQRDERDRQRRELERARIEQEKQIRDRQRQDENFKEEKERQDRQRIAEERREQERIRKEQELRREQERIRQEQERQERIKKEQERMRQEQEERKRREQIERQKQEQERIRREQEKLRLEHERKKREDELRRREEIDRQQRKEQERQRQEQEKLREQDRIRQEQEKIRKEQEMIRQEQDRILQEQERLEQQKMQEEQRDLGLARLSAMGALNDLGEESNNYQYDQSIVEHPNSAFQSGINFHELNMFNQNRQNMIKQENNEQKPFMNNHYNPWINRANELLDLSSSDSRETPVNNEGEQSGFIPQILMNPWDPQQAPMMTLAPIANAMQQYQQQWLSQYQQAAGMLQQDEESYPLGKFRVLCISPDEEMGFLINLPAPCNLLFQTEGLVRKNVDSPFLIAFQKFVKDPEGATRKIENLTEAPDKPPPILPGKKAYVPPYTPKATVGADTKDDKVKVSSSGLSRSLVIEPVKKAGHQARPNTTPARAVLSRSSSQSSQSRELSSIISARPVTKKTKSKNLSDEEEAPATLQELPKRESSRRKAKEQASSKRKAQDKLLMDEDDPTLNNPALDLEDSDDDAEWTPVKDGEGKGGRSRKRVAGDSSDEDDFSEFNNVNKLKVKKRAYPEPDKIMNKRLSTDSNTESTNDTTNTTVPEGEEFKVGSFLILKTETSNLKPSLWRVDGKTLIQKYECLDEEGIKYKNVNTYSGWTASTRHRYSAVSVKVIKSTGQDTIVERLKDVEEPNPPSKIHSETPKTEEATSPPKMPVNVEEIQLKSRGETGQFQENFEVYMQTLISQCLDANFLNEIFSEADEYFVSNIEKVDSVTLLRKDKLLTGVTWTLRFQHALTVWPCLNDLGSEACTSTVCGACEKARAHTMLQMFGQPYNSNTLATIPPNPEAMMNRNFSVCKECSRLCHLYHRLHHQKQKLYMMCSEIVERRKTDSPGIDTTQILNQLLADDTWLETQFKKMQDLWADADCFVK